MKEASLILPRFLLDGFAAGFRSLPDGKLRKHTVPVMLSVFIVKSLAISTVRRVSTLGCVTRFR